MAAVTICCDFGAQEYEIWQFPIFPQLYAMKWCDQMPWTSFFELWVLSQLFHSPLSPSSRGSLVLLCFLPFKVVSSAYLSFLIFHLSIFILASESSNQHFIWCTLHISSITRMTIYSPFPILNHCSISSSNCCFFLCIQVSQKAGKVIWYSHFFSRIFDSLLWSKQPKALV